MVRDHQPGEAVFRSILPEDIDWKPFPAFPPSARLAVLVGEPTQAGPYVVRVKVPSGAKLMPHKHPEDRIYTVMSGVFYIGLGDRFDGDKVKAYPPGSVIVLPGDTWHFHWAKSGEYVTQVTAIGPLGLEYRDPKDDPQNKAHPQSASGGVRAKARRAARPCIDGALQAAINTALRTSAREIPDAHGYVDVQSACGHVQGSAHRDDQCDGPHLRRNSRLDPQILRDRARWPFAGRHLSLGKQGRRRRMLPGRLGGGGAHALGRAAAAAGLGDAHGGGERGAAPRCGRVRRGNPIVKSRVSSVVEQRFCKPLVGSSNLSPGTSNYNKLHAVFKPNWYSQGQRVTAGVNNSDSAGDRFGRTLVLGGCLEHPPPGRKDATGTRAGSARTQLRGRPARRAARRLHVPCRRQLTCER